MDKESKKFVVKLFKIVLAIIGIFVLYQSCKRVVPKEFFVIQVKASSSLNKIRGLNSEFEFHKEKHAIFPPNVNSQYYTINFGPYFNINEAVAFKDKKKFQYRLIKIYSINKIYYCYLPPEISRIIDKKILRFFFVLVIFLYIAYRIRKAWRIRTRNWATDHTWIVWR